MTWLLCCCGFGVLVALVLLFAVAADAAAERRPAPRIGQPVRATPPPLPRSSPWWHADLRHTRIPRPRHGGQGGVR